MTELLRVQRIEMLADLWGRILLFHPALCRPELKLDWHQFFTDVLPQLEQAESSIDVVRVLNESCFRPLDDPLTFAQQLAGPDTTPQDQAVSTRPGGPGTGIPCEELPGPPGTHWIALRDPTVFRSRDFRARVWRILQSLSSVNLLVVDLRWSVTHAAQVPSGLLRLWASSACRAAPKITRVHCGWHELDWPYLYSQKWEVAPGTLLKPLWLEEASAADDRTASVVRAPSYLTVPTLFIANNRSILPLIEPLSALASQAHVRVVWEKTGRFSIPQSAALRYPEGVAVHLNLAAAGFLPDVVLDEPILPEQLATLTSRAFGAAPRRSESACFPDSFPAYPASALGSGATVSSCRAARLLGLIKTWTVLRHFHPHFSQADLGAGAMLPEFIPRVEAAASFGDYLAVLEEIAARLHDGHAAIRHSASDDAPAGSLPVELGLRAGKVVVVRASEGTPLCVGDEVVEIGGRTLEQLLEWGRTRISAASERAFRAALLPRVSRGKAGSSLELTVRRGDVTRKLALDFIAPSSSTGFDSAQRGKASTVAGFALPAYAHAVKILKNRLGYLAPFELPNVALLDGALAMIRETDGLILDLRGYPEAHFQHALVRRLCGGVVSSPRYEIPLATSSDPMAVHRVTIVYRVSPGDEEPRPQQYLKPAVGLVDEEVASSAEDVCMYLRIAHRVTFVGRTTAGCHGNAAFVCLPGGIQLSFTGMHTTWPDGSPFQGVGIVPDVEVEATMTGLLEARDEILEKGAEVLEGLLASQ